MRRFLPAVMPLAYVGFTLLVFWKVWTPIDGAAGFWRFDPRFEYWGDLIFQVDTLGDGTLALWNPWDRGGFPLYGDPQPGMLYPGNWPLLLWGLFAGGVGPAVVAVKILAHWIFGSIGMHLFLRRLGVREPACYAGGVLFGFTCPKVRYNGSALNWSIAWIPWLLLATHWFAEKPSPRRGIVLGSTFAMVLLSGAPAVVLYALIVTVPYAVWLLRGRIRAHWKPIAIAAGVSILWLAPLVLSNMQQVPESVRETRDLGFIAHSAYSPSHLVGFLIPRISHQNVYFGVLALLALVLAARSENRAPAMIFLGVAAAGILLAFGTHAGVLPATASAVPVFGLFRQAHRYVYVTAVAIPIVAALGLSYAISLEDRALRDRLARWVTAIGGALAFALLVALLVSVVIADKLDTDKNDALALAVASAVLSTWALRWTLVRDGSWRVAFGWIAAGVMVIDVWTANGSLLTGGLTPPPVPRNDAALSRLEGVDRDWRIYDWGYFDFRPGTRLAVRDFGGYEDDPLGLSRYKILRDAAKRDLRLLGHANVRYFASSGQRNPRLSVPRSDDFTVIDKGLWQLEKRAPAVYYVADPVHVQGPEKALAALRGIEPGTGAVYEGPPAPAGPPGAAPVAGRIVTLEPNRVVAEIETPGPGLVVIAEAYYPAWTAEVDGRATEIQPANVMFRAVPVQGAGVHRIEMQLRPARFWGALPLYAGGLGLFVWACVTGAPGRRRRSRRPRSSTPPSSDRPTAEESA